MNEIVDDMLIYPKRNNTLKGLKCRKIFALICKMLTTNKSFGGSTFPLVPLSLGMPLGKAVPAGVAQLGIASSAVYSCFLLNFFISVALLAVECLLRSLWLVLSARSWWGRGRRELNTRSTWCIFKFEELLH